MPSFRVSEEQRDRAVERLQEAYVQGRFDAEQFEERVEKALSAETTADIQVALKGLPGASLAAFDRGADPAVAFSNRVRNVGAGLAHLSGLCTGPIGPAVARGITKPGSRVHVESSRALAWQFSMLMVMVITIVVATVTSAGWAVPAVALGWFVGTVALGVRALSGDHSTKAIEPVLPFKPRQLVPPPRDPWV